MHWKPLTLAAALATAHSALAQTPAAAEPAPAEAPPAEAAAEAESVTLAPVVVTGQREDAYVIGNSRTAGKSEAPIKETPATVNVVTRELLDDRAPRNFIEALRTVPGISATSARISTQNLLSRGFSLRQAGGEFRNGLRHFENSNLAPEITNVERFELLKGPASVLYGIGGLGGVMNVVTKQPEATPRTWLEATGGSYDFYRGAIDSTGALDGAGVWSYRFNAHVENVASFQDDVNQQSLVIAPTLAWQPSARTRASFGIEFVRGDLHGNVTGQPADGTVLASPNGPIPRERQIFDTNFNRIARDISYTTWLIDHELNAVWSLHQGFLLAENHKNDLVESNMTGFVGGLSGERRFVQRAATPFAADFRSYALDNHALAKFSTGSVRHELLVGADWYRAENTGFGQRASLPDLDLRNPVYGVQPTSGFTVTSNTEGAQQWFGAYVQETLIPLPELRILAALRATKIKTETINKLNPAASRVADDTPITPRLGVVYTPLAPVSLFASYSTSFVPIANSDRNGVAFEPEEGESVELGIKTEWLDGALSQTLAVFDMKRENVLTTDPADPRFSIQTGEQTSRGVELEVAGAPLPGLDFTAAYTYLDTEVSRDNRLLVGQPLRGVPQHQASVWASYALRGEKFRGLGFGAGLFYEDERWGELVTPANAATIGFNIPSYVRADAAIYWRQPRYELQLNVNNIADADYFSGVLSRNLVYRGDERTVSLTLRHQL